MLLLPSSPYSLYRHINSKFIIKETFALWVDKLSLSKRRAPSCLYVAFIQTNDNCFLSKEDDCCLYQGRKCFHTFFPRSKWWFQMQEALSLTCDRRKLAAGRCEDFPGHGVTASFKLLFKPGVCSPWGSVRQGLLGFKSPFAFLLVSGLARWFAQAGNTERSLKE